MLEQVPPRPADCAALTPREQEVLSMIARGLTNAQAAARLSVTVHAIKFHLSQVYRKLGVSNRTEAAVEFQRLTSVAPAITDGQAAAGLDRPSA